LLGRQAGCKISTRIPRRPPSIGFVAQPTNRSLLGFEAQTKNRSGDFEAQIIKPELLILRPKLGNPSHLGFEAQPRNPTTGFEDKPEETVATSFEAKLAKT
jgi:hypothetical protein